jgi:hypothetical protein
MVSSQWHREYNCAYQYVKKNHRISYDSQAGNEFSIHKPDGTARVFKESTNRLFYFDTTLPDHEHVASVTTVEKNKS